jgi:hypothetical protein
VEQRTDRRNIGVGSGRLCVCQNQEVSRQVQLGMESQNSGQLRSTRYTHDVQNDLVSSCCGKGGQRGRHKERHAIRKQRGRQSVKHKDNPLQTRH